MDTPETNYSSNLSTAETPLTKQISEIPDYDKALKFAETLQPFTHDDTAHQNIFGAPTTADTSMSFEQQQDPHQSVSTQPTTMPAIIAGPRRTQMLPGTAPKSVDKKWKTRSARKKAKQNKLNNGTKQQNQTQNAIDQAMKSTFPPTAFGKQGQGSKLGQQAERNAKVQAAAAKGMASYLMDPRGINGTPPNNNTSNMNAFPFDQNGSMSVPDSFNLGEPKRKKKKRREERYQDQIGVKLSWSAWMNKREDKKFHDKTIKRATSHVGAEINEHRTRLRKMKKIFDPAKIAKLTREFEQKMIARDNVALVNRLGKVANAKTIITKTNDPKERRYVNKVAKDKMRMLRQSKQHSLNALNFENKIILDLLNRSQSSIPSKKECDRHFRRHKTMRSTMSKVFTPKSVTKNKLLAKQKRKDRKKRKQQIQRMKERNRQGGSRGTRNPLYGAARDPLNGQLPPIMQRAIQEQEEQAMLQKQQEQQQEQYFHSEHQRLMAMNNAQDGTLNNPNENGGGDGGMDFSTIVENEEQTEEEQYLSQHALQSGSWRAVLPNPNAMSRGGQESRGSLQSRCGTSGTFGGTSRRGSTTSTGGGYSQGGQSVQNGNQDMQTMQTMPNNSNMQQQQQRQRRGSTGSSTNNSGSTAGSMRGGGLGPIEGAFEKRRMLMEPKDIPMSMDGTGGNRHSVTVSAFRGVSDRLVYEISDSQTGIVKYYDINAELILEIGKSYPILLSTIQTKRVEQLAILLDSNYNYFGNDENIVAKMFWWQGKDTEGSR